MYTWDYKAEDIKKDPKRYLERVLTYGLGGDKVDKKLLEAHLDELNIPADTKAFFELLLWNKTF